MGATSILSIKDLVKVYSSRKRGDTKAVDGVSFDVDRGEVVGLLGPNGAGKTSTIKCAATLVLPTSGAITIDGIDVIEQPRNAVRKVGAILEGNRNVYWRLTPKENISFFSELQGIPARNIRTKMDELLERFGIADKRDTPARMLSKGMQQKLALACVFVKDTPVLLLDEPTLGLDVEASYELRTLVKELATVDGRTILLSSHDMAVVEDTCDRVVIINDGRVVTDDRVSNLIQLFKARAYSFTVSGGLSADQKGQLADRFTMLEIDDSSAQTIINVEFPDGTGFYGLIDILRQGECLIESIDRRDPNLEQIFLRIVKEAERA